MGATVNEVLAQELRKSVIKTFKRRAVYARFKDDIWTVDSVEMRLLFSKNQAVKYLFACGRCLGYIFER